MNLLSELQYFAPVDLYKNVNNNSNIIFESYDRFQKMSFRNRAWVVGAEGPLLLTVPLEEGRDQRKLSREVRVSSRYPWQSNHWKTIVSCYNRSPWFEFYRDSLESLYRKPFVFLNDWNLVCFIWSMEKLKWTNPIEFTLEYQPSYPADSYLDLRGKLMPKSISTQFPQSLVYRQVFEDRIGFIPHMSILDLLFCEGPAAGEKLRASREVRK